MKFVVAILLICSLYFVRAEDEVNDPDVLVLTESNFNSIVDNEDLILVEFYAPWCGHCKKLAPEYAVAATKLLKNDPPIKLGKVDATVHGGLASKFGVRGYPTMKVFRKGNPSDYNGPRDSNGIIEYMKKQVGPSAKPLASKDEFEKFTKGDQRDIAIVGFFPNKNSAYNNFVATADSLREKFKFGVITDSALLGQLNYGQSVVVFRPFDDKQSSVTFTGSETVSDLTNFIYEYSLGLVSEYTKDNADRFTKKGLPVLKAFFDVDFGSNLKRTNYYINRLKKVAEEFGKKVQFAIAHKDKFGDEIEKLGVKDVQGEIKIAIDDAKNAGKYRFTKEFSIENVKAFVQDYLDGKLKSYIKSEVPPATQEGPVTVVTGETFKDIVLNKDKDVLIEFYAPWCGHCKNLEPKYKELAEKLKDVDSVVIAKMDATANDIPHSAYTARGFPTILFAPAGNKDKPLTYEGDRSVKDFISFIKKNASIKIPKDKVKDEL